MATRATDRARGRDQTDPQSLWSFFLLKRDSADQWPHRRRGRCIHRAGFRRDARGVHEVLVADPPENGRIGLAHFANNASFKAVISRFGPPEHLGSVLLLVAVVVMLVVAVIAIRRAIDHDDLVVALIANATAVLLASPVSWSHHWVWAAPALLVLALAVVRAPSAWNAVAATGIGALFLIGPQHLLPTAGDRGNPPPLRQHGFGTLYVTVGFGFLVWLAFGAYRNRSAAREVEPWRHPRHPCQPLTAPS